jgi:hypothetical protein
MLMSLVPKKLHAIWLGGILTQTGKSNIERWVKINPDYEMNVWIDSSTYLGKELSLEKEYKQFKIWAKNNKIRINDINPDSPDRDLVNKPEIFKEMESQNYYLDEISNPGSNYAAASDILREEILYKEGGVYFDAEDVFPGEPLGDLEVDEAAGSILFHAGVNSKNQEWKNNDLIASIAQGSSISKFRTAIKNNYDDFYKLPRKYLIAHRYQHLASFRTEQHGRKLSTQNLSGPHVIVQIYPDFKLVPKFPSHMCKGEPETQALSWFDSNLNSYEKFGQNFRLNLIESFSLTIENMKIKDPDIKLVIARLQKAIDEEIESMPTLSLSLLQMLEKIKEKFEDQELDKLNQVTNDLIKSFELSALKGEEFLLYCKLGHIQVEDLWKHFNDRIFWDKIFAANYNDEPYKRTRDFFRSELFQDFFAFVLKLNPNEDKYSYSESIKKELCSKVESKMTKGEFLLESKMDEQLASIQFAVRMAQNKYQGWYESANKLRGKDGFFSRFAFRHGEFGQMRALSLINNVNASETSEESIEKIQEFLQSYLTRYNRHSFSSFLLDELKNVEGSPWFGISADNEAHYDKASLTN